MSLCAPIVSCLPEDTAEVARAAFPKGNTYLRVYDVLGPIYINPQFAALFPKEGQPAVEVGPFTRLFRKEREAQSGIGLRG